MAIDNCQLKFIELTTIEFPRYLNAMFDAIQNPLAMRRLCVDRYALAHLRVELGRRKDLQGCYVLLDKGVPKYVGISRNVIGRLRQHVMGKTHNDASLAYRMARKQLKVPGTRDQAMADQAFLEVFKSKQEYLKSLDCAFVEILNPLELYLFEAFCAMELDTHEWNTFVTH